MVVLFSQFSRQTFIVLYAGSIFSSKKSSLPVVLRHLDLRSIIVLMPSWLWSSPTAAGGPVSMAAPLTAITEISWVHSHFHQKFFRKPNKKSLTESNRQQKCCKSMHFELNLFIAGSSDRFELKRMNIYIVGEVRRLLTIGPVSPLLIAFWPFPEKIMRQCFVETLNYLVDCDQNIRNLMLPSPKCTQ